MTIQKNPRQQYCDFCGTEIAPGENYWYINCRAICVCCLPEFAREEFRAFSVVCGEEDCHEAFGAL